MVKGGENILSILAAVPALGLVAGCGTAPATRPVRWQQLPNIPDPEGFASPFAGVSGGALIVAGGANFPGKRPWDGGMKKWYDSAFVLDSPNGPWKNAKGVVVATG